MPRCHRIDFTAFQEMHVRHYPASGGSRNQPVRDQHPPRRSGPPPRATRYPPRYLRKLTLHPSCALLHGAKWARSVRLRADRFGGQAGVLVWKLSKVPDQIACPGSWVQNTDNGEAADNPAVSPLNPP